MIWPVFHKNIQMSNGVTPEQLAEYAKQSEELLPKFLALATSSEWKESKKEQDITFYTRTDPSSSYHQVKSVVTIPASIETVISILKPIEVVDASTPKEKRHGLNERKALYGPADDQYQTAIFEIEIESPAPLVSPRDFLLFRRFYQKDGKQVYLHNSIVNDTLFPEKKGVVRGVMPFQGFIVEPDPDHNGNVRLTFLVHADPKGKIPATVYNLVVTNQGYAAKGIRKKAIEASK